MEVMTAGRMAIFADTTGAVIAAWQPGQHLGAQLVNEPGAFIWSELSSSDVAKSKAFYFAVFGWGWGGEREIPADMYVDLGRSAGCPLGTEPGIMELPGRGDRHGDVFGHADVVPAS